MKFYFLATFAMASAVCADSRSSFFIETDTVSSFLRPDSCDHLSETISGSSFQNDDVVQLHPSEEVAASNEAEQKGEALVFEAPKESWWSYGKRMAWGAADVAYQYLRSNRLTGAESGSCQSWTSLAKLKGIEANWRVDNRQQFLLGKNGESVISTQVCDDIISKGKGYEWLGLKGALEKASKIQIQTIAQKVYLPLNLHLTNYVSIEKIMHRVTMEVVYGETGTATSVKILDPQTVLSGEYLSDARALCENAFAGLNKEITAEYAAVGIQLPGTGNCQKMAAYIAVALGEGQPVEGLTLNKANAFCTQLHNAASSERASSKSWLGGWCPRLW